MNAEDAARSTTREDSPPRWWLVPWPGAAVAVLAVAGMVAATVVAWPDMAGWIVTREAGGRHGESTVSREVSGVLLPLTLTLLVVLLSVAPRLDHLLVHKTPLGRDRSPERGRRVLSWLLIGLSPVLAVLHLGVLAMHTGTPFPLVPAMGVAIGLLLVALGTALPLAAPGGRFADPRIERFRAAQGPAYRYGGVAMVLLGIATAGTALLAPDGAVVVATVGVGAVFAGILITAALRARR